MTTKPQSQKKKKKQYTVGSNVLSSPLIHSNSPICATVPYCLSAAAPYIFASTRFFSLSPFGASIRRQACRSVANNFLSFFAFVKGPDKPRISSESLYCMTFLFLRLKGSCRSYGQTQLCLNSSFIREVDRFLSLFKVQYLPSSCQLSPRGSGAPIQLLFILDLHFEFSLDNAICCEESAF